MVFSIICFISLIEANSNTLSVKHITEESNDTIDFSSLQDSQCGLFRESLGIIPKCSRVVLGRLFSRSNPMGSHNLPVTFSIILELCWYKMTASNANANGIPILLTFLK